MTRLVVVTGLSGGGRSVTAGALEDLGWFVIDNLPAALVPKVGELALSSGNSYDQVALVMGGYDDETADQVDALRQQIEDVSVVFLEAADDVLIRRYEATKRRHPLVDESRGVSEAIGVERERLRGALAAADLVIDTSNLNPHELREKLKSHFTDDSAQESMRMTISSFGFKHGIPLDVDLVLDCRFLPNPYWDEQLRSFSGKDIEIQEFVSKQAIAKDFMQKLVEMLRLLLPAYEEEGRSYLTVAFGCTGGRHRSVAIAEMIGKELRSHGLKPRVSHRDIYR